MKYGLLLFLIYINDLPFPLKEAKVTMYADDTSISYSSSSLEDVNRTLNSELSLLKQWLLGNKLSLNILKTQALVVASQPKIKKIIDKTVDHPQFFIGFKDQVMQFFIGFKDQVMITERRFMYSRRYYVSFACRSYMIYQRSSDQCLASRAFY